MAGGKGEGNIGGTAEDELAIDSPVFDGPQRFRSVTETVGGDVGEVEEKNVSALRQWLAVERGGRDDLKVAIGITER